MTKQELATIRNIITKLRQPNFGCSPGLRDEEAMAAANKAGLQATTEVYLETWIIGPLQLLVAEKGQGRNPRLAADMSRVGQP